VSRRQSGIRRRYERILQIDPSAPVASNNLAFIYAEDGGNLDVALQLAEQARRKLPNAPEVADTAGWVYVKRGMPNVAIPLLEESVFKDPSNGTFAYHLATAVLPGRSDGAGSAPSRSSSEAAAPDIETDQHRNLGRQKVFKEETSSHILHTLARNFLNVFEPSVWTRSPVTILQSNPRSPAHRK